MESQTPIDAKELIREVVRYLSRRGRVPRRRV
jgi:hypothetical protein